MSKNADQLARWSLYLQLAGLALWIVVWIAANLISDDPWMLIAGFFMGFVASGVFGIVPASMGVAALRSGTKLKGRAISAIGIWFGMFFLVVVLYAT